MKFEIEGQEEKKEEIVKIGLRKDSVGDIEIIANECTILWIRKDGKLQRTTDCKITGFETDDNGKVNMYGEEQ